LGWTAALHAFPIQPSPMDPMMPQPVSSRFADAGWGLESGQTNTRTPAATATTLSALRAICVTGQRPGLAGELVDLGRWR
jgi:hypothetical protein